MTQYARNSRWFENLPAWVACEIPKVVKGQAKTQDYPHKHLFQQIKP